MTGHSTPDRSDSHVLVSIVLPTLNIAEHIQACLDSCLAQTHANIEIILVDGGSVDQTLAIVGSYTDPRLRVIHQKDNAGRLPGALNLGFAHAHGDYLTWMQGDCTYLPEAIATMASYLDKTTDVDLVYAPFWRIDDAGQTVDIMPAWPAEDILEINSVGHCFLYRRVVYEVIGDYNVSAYLAEDYEYWLRVAQVFRLAPLPVAPLFYYRLSAGALTAQPGVIHKRQRMSIHFRRERFGWAWRRYWLALARVDIDEAFAMYKSGRFDRVPGLMTRGIARNPAWLLNRGVTKITLKTLFHNQLRALNLDKS